MPELNIKDRTPKLSTAKEAAEVMGVPVSQVRNLIRQDRLPHYRIGRYVRIDIDEALSWMREEPRASVDDAPMIIHHNARRKG